MSNRTITGGVALGAALALTLTTFATAGAATSTSVHHTAQSAAAPVPTGFGLSAQAYGVTARGGNLPTLPGRVGYVGLGCTDKAGLAKERNLANLDLGSTGGVKAISSSVKTTKSGATVAASARNKVGQVKLGGSGIGALTLESVTTNATASKTPSGYQAKTSVTALIKLKLPGEQSETLPVPTMGDPIVIPGLLRISLGKVVKRTSGTGAFASSAGLVVKIVPTQSEISVGYAAAQIDAGIKTGIFRGTASPEQVSVAQGLISGPPQLRGNLPCVGTGGKVRVNGLANAEVGPLDLSAVSTRVLGTQGAKTASGFTEGKIAKVELGELEVRGVIGKANVSRTGAKVTATTRGTTVGKVIFDGDTLEFPKSGVLTIPGVARLEQRVVTRSATGLKVSALKLTVLGGSDEAGATVLLGNAEMYIGRPG